MERIFFEKLIVFLNWRVSNKVAFILSMAILIFFIIKFIHILVTTNSNVSYLALFLVVLICLMALPSIKNSETNNIKKEFLKYIEIKEETYIVNYSELTELLNDKNINIINKHININKNEDTHITKLKITVINKEDLLKIKKIKGITEDNIDKLNGVFVYVN